LRIWSALRHGSDPTKHEGTAEGMAPGTVDRIILPSG
jgi:hypothetical protein